MSRVILNRYDTAAPNIIYSGNVTALRLNVGEDILVMAVKAKAIDGYHAAAIGAPATHYVTTHRLYTLFSHG